LGEVLERGGRRAEVKVARDELVVFEFEMAAEMDGAGPHFHKQHVDTFYVLEGELEVTVDGETVRAHSGDLVHVVPGVVHSFKNASRERVRFLNVHAPGMRFDEYIRRMDANDGPDPEQYDSFLTPAG
jgi:quercetin dioxygenase-like cupin family protein